jgi:ABC-type lipoprotein export system ATPase subunit
MFPLIELKRVRREFDAGRIVALDGVSLVVEAGETVAVVGPSGSGKSTLLNLVSGLDRPSSGEVRLDGREIAGRNAWADMRACRIGMIFQNFCLIPTLSAVENVEIAMMGHGRKASHRRNQALALLQRVGVAARSRLRPAELSGGERQRVAIAQALSNDPWILIADESTGSLDRANSLAIMEMLHEQHRDTGTTLLIVTHDASVAGYCDRLVEIVDGRVVRDGPQDERETSRASVAVVRTPA